MANNEAKKELKLKATLDSSQVKSEMNRINARARQVGGGQFRSYGGGLKFNASRGFTPSFSGGLKLGGMSMGGFAVLGATLGIAKMLYSVANEIYESAQQAERGFQKFAKIGQEIATDWGNKKKIYAGENATVADLGYYREKYQSARQKEAYFGEKAQKGWGEMERTFTREQIEWIQKNGIQRTLAQSMTQQYLPQWYKNWQDRTGYQVMDKIANDKTGLVSRLGALQRVDEPYKKAQKDIGIYGNVLRRLSEASSKMSVATVANRAFELNDMSKHGLYTSDFMKQAATQTPELKNLEEQTEILRTIKDQIMSGKWQNDGGLR